MAKHFVTVCVFCLLCATHTPCSSHARFSEGEAAVKEKEHGGVERRPDGAPYDVGALHWRRRRSQTGVGTGAGAGAGAGTGTGKLDEVYAKKIFTVFGNGETMNYEGFEKLIKNLGLERLLQQQEDATRRNDNATCMNGRSLLRSLGRADDAEEEEEEEEAAVVDKEDDAVIGPWNLKTVCPVLLYQVVGQTSAERQGCVEWSGAGSGSKSGTEASTRPWRSEDGAPSESGLVWLYSILSVFAISACGLLGVLVIPIMNRRYYRNLIQYLVALAVGTLTGDALLHLLPHAMSSHGHGHAGHAEDHDPHSAAMWRGLAAALGFVFFFVMEKLLTLCAEWRKKRQLLRDKLPARVRVMRETDGGGGGGGGAGAGDKLCKHKYSSYPYCYDVIATEGGAGATGGDVTDAALAIKSDELQDHNNRDAAYTTVILREHENEHHGHSHAHGHVHSAPDSMSGVAWMVIMGDGLHNLTDGMAIGAAFAGSLAGGFSTAVAVFCHELPHEIGDFAVLLKTGMSARQAVFYNLLSSVLCLLGCVVGVFAGTDEDAAGWVFAAAAGMFLYIALVDMIPELTTGHSKEGGSLGQCALQFAGLLCGISVMLLIALYEHDLKQLFVT